MIRIEVTLPLVGMCLVRLRLDRPSLVPIFVHRLSYRPAGRLGRCGPAAVPRLAGVSLSVRFSSGCARWACITSDRVEATLAAPVRRGWRLPWAVGGRLRRFV